jgi:hypothetical protein
MRNDSLIGTPSLFTPELLTGGELETPQDSTQGASAREFVRWCWNVGSDFRNSPDITNLRYWLQKKGAQTTPSEEDDILVEARRIFLKKVEQAVRKADVPKESA